MKLVWGIAPAIVAAGLSLPAMATPVAIQNGFILAGVSDYGTLGSDGNTSPGILYDKTGTGNYGVNDFLTPGSPFEGFYVQGTFTSGGSYYNGANNAWSAGFGFSSPTALSATSATWSGTDGTLNVLNNYTLSDVAGREIIAISTTLTNVSGQDLSDLLFERTLDPDPDVNTYGSYFTNNTVVSPNEACGTGPDTGQTICISTSSDFTHLAGVSASWSQTPADYLAGLNDGNGDYTIGLGFDLGALANGNSVTFNYAYDVGADLGTASTSSVPEPTSIALLGVGLFGLGFVATRRRGRSGFAA